MKKTTPQSDILAYTWDASRLGEAMETLARMAALNADAVQDNGAETDAQPPADLSDALTREHWAQWLASRIGIEAELTDAQYAEIDEFVCGVAPALIELEAGTAVPRLLVLLKSTRGRVTLLTPELSKLHVAPQLVRDAICRPVEQPFLERTDRLLAQVGIEQTQHARVRRLLLAEQLGALRVARGWILRESPGASWAKQLRAARALPLAAVIVGASILQLGLTLLAWVILGRAALTEQFNWAWLGLWAIVLLMNVPLQMLTTSVSARLGTNVGAAYKTTLLYGASRLSPEEIRHEGAGTFLSRMLDADRVENNMLVSIVPLVLALIQILTAVGILWLGVGGWLSVLMLVLVCAVTFILSLQLWRANDRYEGTYRNLTNHLVERMVGYRTRLAQQDPAKWHTEEDAELSRYLHVTEKQARTWNWLATLPRVWMILGLASVAPAFIGQTVTLEKLAISLGGIFLAEQALNAIMNNLRGLVSLGNAWNEIKPLLAAAHRPEQTGVWMLPASAQTPNTTTAPRTVTGANPLLSLREVSYRYHARAKQALDNVTLDIFDGDRLLVQGPSGGGKSTLAAVIAGLRMPESGLLLLRGYDRASVGQESWRRHVTVAPQFHENHVFTGTFSFNVLMGRRWPADVQDGLEALAICQELGLDDLISKMPSQTQQIVGDHGWQLSHGERSRLYIARALLQRAELIILDESFAALDPENLERALRCVFKRAPTLLVIAHP